MATPRRPKFSAIIVGGSVAGLTLAHMFEKAGIDYILLEGRDTISPSTGASIVIMPNGARILDQLGLYEAMVKGFMAGMATTHIRRSNGELMSTNDWPKRVEKRLRYMCGISERQKFLWSMYDQLKDKSKIHLAKRVLSVQHGTDSVTVVCTDGSKFVGDIVIGADGIHSQTRQEMQRYADETGPPGMMDKDKNAITAQYSCFFGMSTAMPNLAPGDGHIASDIDHSFLLFAGKDSLAQWFFFSKLPEKYIGAHNIPRLIKADIDASIAQHGDFHVTPDITLDSLVDNVESSSFFALEEANHEHWTYGRIVCVGDAIHKMTPNLGQGGNQAIESAAVLTNCLVEMLTTHPTSPITEHSISATLLRYQTLRQKRAKMVVNFAGAVTRMDALATLSHTLRFLFMPHLSSEVIADLQTEVFRKAPFLEFLEQPERVSGNELWMEGVERVQAREAALRAEQGPKARL